MINLLEEYIEVLNEARFDLMRSLKSDDDDKCYIIKAIINDLSHIVRRAKGE